MKTNKMNISIIAAIDENYGIGKNNALLWHLPADLKFFKAKTTGHSIIMGRNTFESIGGGRPLPNRTTIIITRNREYSAPQGCIIVHSLEQALTFCSNEDEVFVCGGAQIYELALPIAHTMYITHVHTQCNADTFFPKWNTHDWVTISKNKCTADEKHTFDFTFAEYRRKNL